MTKRKRSKYPALDKGLNLKSRKDFIETDYVDGVKSKNGETVIRPLNDYEKSWLNQYYEETVVTNFNHHPELERLNREKKAYIECDYVKQMKAQIKDIKSKTPNQDELITELKEVIKLTKEQNSEKYARQIRKLEKKMQEVRDSVLLYPNKEDHKKFYTENNKRNMCIYNNCKKTGTLLEFTAKTYDNFTAKYLDNVDCEMILVNKLEKDDD